MSQGCLICQREVTTFSLSMPVSQSLREERDLPRPHGFCLPDKVSPREENSGGLSQAAALPLQGMEEETRTSLFISCTMTIPDFPIPVWNSKRTSCQRLSLLAWGSLREMSYLVKVCTWRIQKQENHSLAEIASSNLIQMDFRGHKF